jgi:glycosyltransferase involved in cell wall biosynthesis
MPEEVLAWFDKNDILFVPSLSEGLPVVGMQALAKRLASVVSKIGGFVDLVDEGQNGFLVDGNQLSRFSIALQQFLEDSLQMAFRFDINRIVDRYENVFAEIVRYYY